ncbi:toxin-antitoxin system HicB family antitoxin [Streptomyces sp. NPDC088387]|uniref:toxin-antitoxin system HicB family antitoxin n=1 Tax=Streptomyces sp. NPDC088387 TaxID=3365859 RepID=UPI00380BDF58
MAKTQLNVRVDEGTARAARERALARGMSVNRYIEELVMQDTGEVGHTFVEAAADFMKQYESVFSEEFDTAPAGRTKPAPAEDREGRAADRRARRTDEGRR